MTARHRELAFTDPGEAADLGAFLGRLLHYDRAAAVRLQTSGAALAVFGRPPSFEVLAVRTVRLAKAPEPGPGGPLDVTVSAGDLLETVDEQAAAAAVPDAVTGPPWAGLLPPRTGWQPRPGLPGPEALRGMVAEVVAEFRTRTEALGAGRNRAALDRIGREVWARPVGDTDLPVRAVHAAQALGFLRTPRSATPQAQPPVGLFAAGRWLRLSTPYGAVAVRGQRDAAGHGPLGALSVTPVRRHRH